MVLKELILKFLLWEGVVVLKELIFLTISTFRGCGGPERTDFNSFLFRQVWWS